MAVTNNNWTEIIMTAGADAILGRMKISYIRWDGVTTAGHDLVLTDTNGVKKRTVKSSADNSTVEIVIDDMWDGLIVSTLDSGIVRAFLE